MALNPSALAADDSGHAASVQASGGNKIKLQKGTAVFKDIKITAEEAGEYVLRIASGSRKVRHATHASATSALVVVQPVVGTACSLARSGVQIQVSFRRPSK